MNKKVKIPVLFKLHSKKNYKNKQTNILFKTTNNKPETFVWEYPEKYKHLHLYIKNNKLQQHIKDEKKDKRTKI